MTERDYMAEARAAVEFEAAQRIETAIADKASHLREADEREARHAALRQKHGLHDAATPREIADAEIAHGHAWRSFIGCRFASSSRAAEILSPEIVTEDRRSEILTMRDRLRDQFEQQYARDVANRERNPHVDGFHGGHNLTVAA